MTSLSDLLTKTSKEIEFVVEISRRNVLTDVEDIYYASKLGTVPDTGSGDTPPNKTFPPLLDDPGTISVSLSEDLLFSGISQATIGGIRLKNDVDSPTGVGLFDDWSSVYSFGGRDLVIRAGEPLAAYSTYEIVYKGKIRQEPIVTADDVTFELQSPMERLDVPLRVNRYLGIPTGVKWLTATGSASAAHIAAYNLTSFTLIHRFCVHSNPTALATIWLKQISFSDRNFYGFMNTLGNLECHASIGGVDKTLLSSGEDWADGLWHTVVWGLLDKTTTYLMIDGAVVDEETAQLTGSVDVQTAAVSFGINLVNGTSLDVAIVNSYLGPDEARVFTANAIESDATGVVASWRCDDNGGGTITDYSPNGNDATLSGVVNTDYEWAPSDLGTPEWAGKLMPAVHGIVFNAPLHYHDTIRERLRGHDGIADPGFEFTEVRSRGAILTEPADYSDLGDGIIEAVGELDEPTNYDADCVEESRYPYAVTRALCLNRGGFETSDLNANWSSSFSTLLPVKSGILIQDNQNLSAAMSWFLRGLSAHARYEPTASEFIFHHLLPPIGVGPYGSEKAVVEFTGDGTSKIDFGNIANPTGSITLACWVKTFRGLTDVTAGSFGSSPLISKISGLGIGYGLSVGSDGTISFYLSGVGELVTTSPFTLKLGTWYFICAVFDNSLDTQTIYIAAQGDTPVIVAVATGRTGTPTTSSIPLYVGNNSAGLTPHAGSIVYPQVWGKAHSAAQVTALMSAMPTGPTTDLLMFAPLTDGPDAGTTVSELALGGTGTMSGLLRWAPKLVVDLSLAANTEFSERALMPLSKLRMLYRKNYDVLTQADIALGVSQDTSRNLKTGFSELSLSLPDVLGDYLDTRAFESIESPLYDESAARYVFNLMLDRFRPGRRYGVLSGLSRDGLLLDLTDEIKIISSRHDLSSGAHFRIVNKTSRLSDLESDFHLWR